MKFRPSAPILTNYMETYAQLSHWKPSINTPVTDASEVWDLLNYLSSQDSKGVDERGLSLGLMIVVNNRAARRSLMAA